MPSPEQQLIAAAQIGALMAIAGFINQEWLKKHSRKIIGAIIIILIMTILFVIVPLTLGDVANVQSGRFWIQTVAGNWPGSPYPDQRQYDFAASAVVGVLLNNGIIAVIATLVWKVVTRERKKIVDMILKHAFDTQEIATKYKIDQVLSSYPDLKKKYPDLADKIDEAFVAGERESYEHLVAAFGRKQADEFLKSLQREVPKPSPS